MKLCLLPTYTEKSAFLMKSLFLLIEESVIALVEKEFSPAPKHMPCAINCLLHTHQHLQNCYNSLGFFSPKSVILSYSEISYSGFLFVFTPGSNLKLLLLFLQEMLY